MEAKLKSALTRALASKGGRRVQDITEALSLARQLAGPSNRGLEARNDLESLNDLLDREGVRNSLSKLVLVDQLRDVIQIAIEDGPQAAKSVQGLRAMLKDDGIRDNPLALAKLARHLRDLRDAE